MRRLVWAIFIVTVQQDYFIMPTKNPKNPPASDKVSKEKKQSADKAQADKVGKKYNPNQPLHSNLLDFYFLALMHRVKSEETKDHDQDLPEDNRHHDDAFHKKLEATIKESSHVTPKRLSKSPHGFATPNGTVVNPYTPFKNMRKVVHPKNSHAKYNVDIFIFSKHHRPPRMVEPVYKTLKDSEKTPLLVQKVSTNPSILKTQQPRSKATRTDKAFGGKSATKAVEEFLAYKYGITDNDLSAYKFERCHKIGFRIGHDGNIQHGTILSEASQKYDAQTKDNLAAAPRALNCAMLLIELVIIHLLKENKCKSVVYECVSQNYKDSQILASLTINFTVETLGDHMIEMSHTFDVTDGRFIHNEISALLLQAIATSDRVVFDDDNIVSMTAHEDSDLPDPAKQLIFDDKLFDEDDSDDDSPIFTPAKGP
jgi:hypothetical protein